MTDAKPPLAEQIKEARRQRGWSQKELAELCKVSVETVTNWERGRHPKNKEALVKRVLELGDDAAEQDTRSISQYSDAELIAELLRRHEQAAYLPGPP